MPDSLTAILVEPHQCPVHQSILLTQGPIPDIFVKHFENWRFWKIQFFWVGHFRIFFASSPWKSVKGSWRSRMGRNFDDYLGFQPKITHARHYCPQYRFKKFQIHNPKGSPSSKPPSPFLLVDLWICNKKMMGIIRTKLFNNTLYWKVVLDKKRPSASNSTTGF